MISMCSTPIVLCCPLTIAFLFSVGLFFLHPLPWPFLGSVPLCNRPGFVSASVLCTALVPTWCYRGGLERVDIGECGGKGTRPWRILGANTSSSLMRNGLPFANSFVEFSVDYREGGQRESLAAAKPWGVGDSYYRWSCCGGYTPPRLPTSRDRRTQHCV